MPLSCHWQPIALNKWAQQSLQTSNTPFQKDFRHLVENMQSASAKDKHLEATMKSTAM